MIKRIIILAALAVSAAAHADIASQLADIWDCVTNIDAAIVAKGGTLVNGGGIRNAAAGIASIPTGGPAPVIQSLTVTTNGVYTAPTGVDGFSPVVVSIVPPEPEKEVVSVGGVTPYGLPSDESLTGTTIIYLDADGDPIETIDEIETLD